MRSTIILLLLMPLGLLAQEQPAQQSFDDVFNQMHRMMLKGFPGMDTTIVMKPGQKQYFQMGPDSSSYFYFQYDTTFQGGTDLFRMNPFGNTSPGNDPFGSSFFNFDDMFRQMEEMQRQFWGYPDQPAPSIEKTKMETNSCPRKNCAFRKRKNQVLPR